MKYQRVIYFLSLISGSFLAGAQCPNSLAVNAGADQVYTTASATLGGNPCATGGVPGYTYLWAPNNFFTGGTNNTQCAPAVAPTITTMYTLTVTDAAGCIKKDYVLVMNHTATVTYVVPKKEIDGGYQVVQGGKVYFKFEEEYVGGTLNCKITDYNPVSPGGQAPTEACTMSSTVKTLGDNRYYFTVSTCNPTLGSSKFYLVELTNDKKEKFYFKFKS